MHTWPSSVTFHLRVLGNDDDDATTSGEDAADDGNTGLTSLDDIDEDAKAGVNVIVEDSKLLLGFTRRLLSATIGVE